MVVACVACSIVGGFAYRWVESPLLAALSGPRRFPLALAGARPHRVG